ncbi:alpha/beta hydrolase [Aureimonas fodinaquatilis]|uniref:Alpha/beta hydrolase n=1 Tax=Aureimonas fodinaquatilis TaxID=2565783 RepID=A0A5B0DYM1_9HYPH|nr:alpha/beta hydrolase [Aureimonas fodinaquatilis]KAA0970861.1 alpha/beta hydrolase [Aureimonas fodinaquatilis]
MADSGIFFLSDMNPHPERLSGGFVATPNRRRLRYAISRPVGQSRGTTIIFPGRNEYLEKYFETMADLNKRGFTALIFDWRGQGGSDRILRNPAKGHIGKLDEYFADFEMIFKNVALPDCPRPYSILAHSLGGLVALRFMPRLVSRVERLVCSAPLIAIPGSPRRQGLLAFLVASLRYSGLGRLPFRRLNRTGADWNVATNPLTSDPHRFERNRQMSLQAPHLGVSMLTAGWLHASFRAMRKLRNSDVIATMHLPTLFVLAGADTVVDTAAAEKLAWRMRSGHSLTIPYARHELLQEKDEYREQLLAAYEGFVESSMPLISYETAGLEPENLPEPTV